MKSVLISIQPRWCELIASGKKTVEVRKTKPKLETPFKVYIYCTNTKPFLVWGDVFRGDWETEFTHLSGYNRKEAEKIWDVFNGKVIGEFICRNIDEYDYDQAFDESMGCFIDKYGYNITYYELGQSCLSYEELENYGNTNRLYGWHISDLEIYDTPKDLTSFYQKCKSYPKDEFEYDDCLLCENPCGNGGKLYLKRPPQSWCYVEEVE